MARITPDGAVRCRCKRCGHRKTFSRNPENYTRRFRWLIKCGSCGYTGKQPGDLPWWIDTYRSSGREHRRVLCKCDRYWFPHRKKSRFCLHAVTPLTEADYEDYERLTGGRR